MTRKIDKNIVVTPIMTQDTGKRLDALIRRLGGKPKAEIDPHKMVLPMPRRDPVEDQADLFDDATGAVVEPQGKP